MVLGKHRPNFGGTFGLKPRDSNAWLVRMEMLIQDYRGCAQQGRSLHAGRGEWVLGNAVLGQDGQAARGILSLGFWGQAQWAGPGWTPDPSPGRLLQLPALGRVQAGTCPCSLACPGLLPSSAIICFL